MLRLVTCSRASGLIRRLSLQRLLPSLLTGIERVATPSLQLSRPQPGKRGRSVLTYARQTLASDCPRSWCTTGADGAHPAPVGWWDLPRSHWWRLSGGVHITAVGSRGDSCQKALLYPHAHLASAGPSLDCHTRGENAPLQRLGPIHATGSAKRERSMRAHPLVRRPPGCSASSTSGTAQCAMRDARCQDAHGAGLTGYVEHPGRLPGFVWWALRSPAIRGKIGFWFLVSRRRMRLDVTPGRPLWTSP